MDLQEYHENKVNITAVGPQIMHCSQMRIIRRAESLIMMQVVRFIDLREFCYFGTG